MSFEVFNVFFLDYGDLVVREFGVVGLGVEIYYLRVYFLFG